MDLAEPAAVRELREAAERARDAALLRQRISFHRKWGSYLKCGACGGRLARDVFGDRHEFAPPMVHDHVVDHERCGRCGESESDKAHLDDDGHAFYDTDTIADRMDSRGNVRPPMDRTHCPHGNHRAAPIENGYSWSSHPACWVG